MTAADDVRLDAALLATRPLPVDHEGDKHTRGTVLVIGGSSRTPGAVLLAGEAALRMGAGRLQIATADQACTAVAVAMPEALVTSSAPAPGDAGGDREERPLEDLVARADAVLLGSGMPGRGEAHEVLARCLPVIAATAIVVVDAAGLPALRDLPADLLAPLRGRLVLTPNRGEVRSLAGTGADGDGDDPDEALEQAAAVTGAVVTSFGRVVAPDTRSWSCGHGAPGLGTSGSGDVLAGLVLGAAARCRDAVQATWWGTYVHHRAGHRLAQRLSALGFLARDIVAEIPNVLRELEREEPAAPASVPEAGKRLSAY